MLGLGIERDSAGGMLFPATAYNIALSPKRNLLRNGRLIHAVLWQQEDQDITFQINKKNYSVVSNLGSGQIVESANVPISSLPVPLFQPSILEFASPAPKNIQELIMANPYGRVNFSVEVKGRVLKFGGLIKDVALKPGTNEAVRWSLIVCPDVDLTALVG